MFMRLLWLLITAIYLHQAVKELRNAVRHEKQNEKANNNCDWFGFGCWMFCAICSAVTGMSCN